MPNPADLRRRLRALAVAGLPVGDLWSRSDALLRRHVPYDVGAWGQVDPATLLSTGCLVLGLPFDAEREREILRLEHDDGDVNRLVDLVRRTPPAGSLDLTTGGHPERSARYPALLGPLGIRDDLRVAMVRDGLCWGSVYAYRRSSVFTAAEVALLGSVAGDLADGVRLALLRADAMSDGSPDSPGLLLMGADGRVTAVSEVADRWLRLLAPDGRIPPVVTSLLAALGGAHPGPARARVQTEDGRWLVLHASHIDGAGSAVIVEAARPVELAEVLCAAYGLTVRERDVVGPVLRGEANRSVARTLGISEYTVKEHLKSVFGKVGVLSRAELAARLLHEQYLPRRDAGVPAGSAGWFRETA